MVSMVNRTGAVYRLLPLMVIILCFGAFDQLLTSHNLMVRDAQGVEESISPISITYNSGLESHSSVRQGNGTLKNPYIISDYHIDCTSSGATGISIRYTTDYLKLRNITIDAHSNNPAIFLASSSWNSQNIVLENITINGGGVQLYLYIPVRVTVTRCNFNNPSGTGNIIYSYSGTEDYLINNTFDCPNMDINIDYTSVLHMLRNKGIVGSYDHLRWRYSNFANNSFETSELRFISGYFSDLQGNDIHAISSGVDPIQIIDCNRIKIANNTIHGGENGIFVQHPNTYSPVRTDYPSWGSLRFDDNFINGSKIGIRFYHVSGDPTMTYFRVFNNTFNNCSSYAISLTRGGSATSMIWHNRFIRNNGAGNTLRPGFEQAEDYYGQMMWDNGKYGNHWGDLTTPDENSDGIVDDQGYLLRSISSKKDQFPVTNPLFDFEKPELKILTPSTTYLSNSYINITWEARDKLSGIGKVEVKFSYGPWIDITGLESYGIYSEKGDYRLAMRVTDGSGLIKEVEKRVIINSTVLPFDILSPVQGGYYNSTSVPVSWSLEDHFTPSELIVKLDEEEPNIEDPRNPFVQVADEGEHELLLTFKDEYGNNIQKLIEFTVDTADPKIDILYPFIGSVISNDLVHFQWDAEDNFGIERILTKIDQEPVTEKSGDGFSIHLGKGPHTMFVEAFDHAGNSETDSISFIVSRNTSLNILTPAFTKPTKEMEFIVSWEYLVSNLVLSNIKIHVDNEEPIDIPLDTTSHTLTLIEEGPHKIEVIAEDPAGNRISDHTEVIIDQTPPSPRFISPSNGDYLNSRTVGLEWSVIERFGIERYELYVDSDLIIDDLSQGIYTLDLDEGTHDILVRAFDRAGNIGTQNMTVHVDLNDPVVTLITPVLDIIDTAYLDISWSVQDDTGIHNFNLTFDNKTYVMGRSTNREVPVEEGEHTITIECKDLAGNIGTVSKEIIIDATPPDVRFLNKPEDHVNTWDPFVKWEIIEEIGIGSINLTIDGKEYQVDPKTTSQFAELNEGEHQISILVSDLAGHNGHDLISFVLDMTKPMINRTTEPFIVEGSKATVFWDLQEGLDDLSWTLFMDGSEIKAEVDLDKGSHVFTEMEPGNHSVILKVRDLAGNEEELKWDFQVKDQNEETDRGQGNSFSKWMIIIVILLIGITAMVLVVIRKRRGGKVPEPQISKAPAKPDKIKLGGIQARNMDMRTNIRTSPPMVMNKSGPQSKETHSHQEHKKDDGAYYRPRSKEDHPKKRKIIEAPDHESPSSGIRSAKEDSGSTHVKPIFTPPKTKEEVDDVEQWGELEDWEPEELEEWSEMEEI